MKSEQFKFMAFIALKRLVLCLSINLVLLFLLTNLALASLQWHQFGSECDKDVIVIGDVNLVVERQQTTNTGFKGDDLCIFARNSAQGTNQYCFTSSYGYGSVAVHSNLLFLKYGEGRGTAARRWHIKVLQLDKDLDELVDVQCSYYIDSNLQNLDVKEVEYELNAKTEAGYTTLFFSLPKPEQGIPSEKIIKIKNAH